MLSALAAGFLIVLSQPAPAFGWKCGVRSSLEERIASADVIFVGKALDSRRRGRDVRTTRFEVITPYKGKLKTKQRVMLRTCVVGSKCARAGFRVNDVYLIAASVTQAGLEDLGPCTSSVSLPYGDPWAQRFLEVLRRVRLAEPMTAGLAWTFRHKFSTRTDGKVVFEKHHFTRRGPNLELYVRVSRYPDRAAAKAAFEALLAGADPNTGLSYGWDRVALGGTQVIRTWAPCRFSKPNAMRVFANARRVFFPDRDPDDAFTCSCGGGCGR